MGEVQALVDGWRVPCNVSQQDLNALCNAEVIKLRECFGVCDYVTPDSGGTFRLMDGQRYTIVKEDVTSELCNGEDRELFSESNTTSVTYDKPDLYDDTAILSRVGGELCCGSRTTQPVSGAGRRKSAHLNHSYDSAHAPVADGGSALFVDGIKSVMASSQSLRPLERDGKHFQDPVHGYVHLPNVAVRIIDTVEFQRLRTIKQLGTVCFLYPSATHTRFEHSVGVAHLASEMIKHIVSSQPELQITQADALCVIIAALCHDLGHGPFSHSFEIAVNRLRSRSAGQKPWFHEHMSVSLLRRILKKINIREYGLNDDDVRFIELCIAGLSPLKPWPENIGRPEAKRFLLEIVSNKRNGMDVDKLDYFHRDSIACYGGAAVDVQIRRLIKSCKVLCCEGQYQICFEEKMALSLEDMFRVRAKLHKHAYQHRVTLAVEQMIVDVLHEADPYFFLRGSNGRDFRISECVEDEEAFCKLGDWLLEAIVASSDPRLAAAQSLIRRIWERDLYSVVGMKTFVQYNTALNEGNIRSEMIEYCRMSGNSNPALSSNLVVNFINITYDKTDSSGVPTDPIAHMAFHSPKNPAGGAFRLPEQRTSYLFSPLSYGEKSLIVFVKDRAFIDCLRDAFNAWVSAHSGELTVTVPVHNGRTDESPTYSNRTPGSQDPNSRRDHGGINCDSSDTVTILTGPRDSFHATATTPSSHTNILSQRDQDELDGVQTSQCGSGGSELQELDARGRKRNRYNP